jgi:high-affinity iron transporter
VGNVLFVVWRESLEAVLVIGILHSFLARRRDVNTSKAIRAMWAGVAGGIVLSVLLAYSTMFVQDQLQGRALDGFQAGILLLSAVLMTQMVLWMNRNGKRFKNTLESEIREAMTSSGIWGAGLVAMFAVAREGTETVVYLYGLALENRGLAGSWAMAGAAALGLVLALATAGAVARGIRYLSYPVFFKFTSYILLLSASGLLVSGVAKLIEMDVLSPLVDPVWNTGWLLDNNHGFGAFLATLAGYRARPSLTAVLVYGAFWFVSLMLMNRQGGANGTTEPVKPSENTAVA